MPGTLHEGVTMPEAKELFTCRGGNYAISLYVDKMVIRSGLTSAKVYELPLGQVRSVIVERKSIIPFATATLLAAIIAVLSKYNALWFVINLTPGEGGQVSTVALLVSILCAIPTIARALFVNMTVRWDGEPSCFHLRFVLSRRGRHLARRFHELSVTS